MRVHLSARSAHALIAARISVSQNMSLIEVTNQKGGIGIVVDGYWYNFDKELANGRKRWTCCKRGGKTKCRAAVNTFNKEVINDTDERRPRPQHTCDFTHMDIKMKSYRQELKKKAIESPSALPSNIINEVHHDVKDDIELRKRILCKRNASTKVIHYARKKRRIKEPKNLADLKITGNKI